MIVKATLALGAGSLSSQRDDGTVNDWWTGYGELEVAASLDYDPSAELGVAAQMGDDDRGSMVILRGRLVRPLDGDLSYFGMLGVPISNSPAWRLGPEVGAGLLYALSPRAYLQSNLHFDALFALDPLSKVGTVFMFNASVGGRMIF